VRNLFETSPAATDDRKSLPTTALRIAKGAIEVARCEARKMTSLGVQASREVAVLFIGGKRGVVAWRTRQGTRDRVGVVAAVELRRSSGGAKLWAPAALLCNHGPVRELGLAWSRLYQAAVQNFGSVGWERKRMAWAMLGEEKKGERGRVVGQLDAFGLKQLREIGKPFYFPRSISKSN
jgi:hypothetical protein